VARLFISAGIPAASIDGSMTSEQRRDLLQALGTGRIRVLTSCALIGEGVDVPSVGGCILLRPTASTSLHLQMIGRCLRPSPGKAAAVVLDHVGNTLRLGHHLEPREWTLDGLAKRDRDAAPSVKVCPQCFAAMASQAKQCGECGHAFAAEVRELQQVEGELVELSINLLQRGSKVKLKKGTNNYIYTVEKILDDNTVCLKREFADGRPAKLSWFKLEALELVKSDPRRQQGTAQSLDDLRKLAQQRGYKRGWAERVYQARLAKRYGM
jgi:hypothetical protein